MSQMIHTRSLVFGITVLSALATAAVATVPALAFAYRNPELHIALQTAEALIGFLVAYLVLGRFRRRRRLPDLLICLAFAALALSNLGFSALPAVFGDDQAVHATWAGAVGWLIGAILLVAGALSPDRSVQVPEREMRVLLFAMAALFAVVWGVVELFDSALPPGVEAVAGDPHQIQLDGHWAILVAQAASVALYVTAAAGFTRGHERSGDPLLAWLAVAAVLSAAARANYFLYPSLFSDYVYSGDLFRLGFYLVVLAAATREIRSYWHETAAAAAYEERSRIARDLHDGMAQELTSIQRNLRWLDSDDEFVRRAEASVERARAQARRAMRVLGEGTPLSVGDALAETVHTVADREGVRVVFKATGEPRLEMAERDALLMIAAEAITNAARHSDSDLIRVELSGARPVRLSVVDDGRGFDPAAVRTTDGGGMGLEVMRARAEGIGATFWLDSRLGAGTSIEVSL